MHVDGPCLTCGSTNTVEIAMQIVQWPPVSMWVLVCGDCMTRKQQVHDSDVLNDLEKQFESGL